MAFGEMVVAAEPLGAKVQPSRPAFIGSNGTVPCDTSLQFECSNCGTEMDSRYYLGAGGRWPTANDLEMFLEDYEWSISDGDVHCDECRDDDEVCDCGNPDCPQNR